MIPQSADLLSFAFQLADLARPIARQHFRQLTAVDAKPDQTPVTVADRNIETAMREHIAKHRPNDGVLGEEFGSERTDAEYVWVLDPIDGTKSFTSGNPLFGTLIGLMQRGLPIVGVLDAPAIGERYHASLAGGSFRNGEPLQVRATQNVKDAVLGCTTIDALHDHDGHRALRQQTRWINHGADCLAYAFLAAGHMDLIVDTGLHVHDWCALVPIVEEAGGRLCDWNGQRLGLHSDGEVIAAASPALLHETVSLLRN